MNSKPMKTSCLQKKKIRETAINVMNETKRVRERMGNFVKHCTRRVLFPLIKQKLVTTHVKSSGVCSIPLPRRKVFELLSRS